MDNKVWFFSGIVLGAVLMFTFLIEYSERKDRLEVVDYDALCEAIWYEEGADKTNYSYGIKSVRCNDQESCRDICLRTVKRSHNRFITDHGRTVKDFVVFLSRSYDAGDSRKDQEKWAHNVMLLYKQQQ